jgi:hypothetical protein
MKRLVYSPSIKAWVKADSGVVDLSPYIIDCTIKRNIDDVSKAEITFRNPKVTQNGKNRFMFTQHEDENGQVRPVFHPMDPITIVMERVANKPVQVFTGYCDTTPYVQLFPGAAKISASCTLKRLLYTYWDPGLLFVRDFMKNYGWDIGNEGQAVNQRLSTKAENPADKPIKSVNLNDSSIGNLVYATLNEIGGWDPSNIFIQPLPDNIATTVSKLFDEIVQENKNIEESIADVMQKIVGSGSYGALGTINGSSQASTGGGSVGTAPIAAADAPQLLQKLINECNRIANHRTYYSQAHRNGSGGVNQPNKASDGSYYFDCSSFTSYMMNFIGHYGGNMTWAEVSGWFQSSWGKQGKGKYLTVWANPEHVFLEIKDRNGSSKFIGTSSHVEGQNPDSHSPVGHSHTIGWLSSYPTDAFTPKHIPGF